MLLIMLFPDPEDFVVARVLASLASLVELGLLAKGRMLETFSHIYGFLCHPSSWIRQTCAVLIEKISFKLRTTDTWCIMYPYIRPLLDADLPSLNMLEILDVVQQPVGLFRARATRYQHRLTSLSALAVP